MWKKGEKEEKYIIYRFLCVKQWNVTFEQMLKI